jgi:hypothetical protein
MPSKDEVQEFSFLIEKTATEQDIGCMDAICQYCKDTGLEIELAAQLISSALKAKIRAEAESVNLLKKSSKLPI